MDKTSINQLLSEIIPICVKANQAREEKRKRGEYFNVFNTFRLKSEEVRLHSAFLAELLNPKGSHWMGAAFLKQFLLMIVEDEEFINSSNINQGQSIVERSIGTKTVTTGGRIDVIIEDGTNALVIENKMTI